MLFIGGGILPVVYLALRTFAHRRRPGSLEPDAATEHFTEVPDQSHSTSSPGSAVGVR